MIKAVIKEVVQFVSTSTVSNISAKEEEKYIFQGQPITFQGQRVNISGAIS